jgi:lambda family phage tail tape measure protein
MSRKIKTAIQQAAPSWQQFKGQGLDALKGDLTTFLSSTINNVQGVGDAFRQLGSSVIASLQQIVAQMLVTMIFTKLLKSSISGLSSGGFVGGDGGGSVNAATGGLIRGPGSATSDSIPARLSDGEYVVNADAVKKIGLPALEAINRGLRTPAIQAMPVQRYADGGLVRSGGSSAMDLHVGIGLDAGVILKALSSKAAGKIVLQHLTDNPKAAGRALQRSQ